jgi:signal transduction histidine kinase
LALLTEHVQHVKEIVATQQSYAKVSGLVQEVSLSTLVEDAIRMVQPGLERHNIGLERDFEDLPPILADKHRTLQILLNLLRNAEDAVKNCPNTERVIRVRIAQHSEDRVRLEVKDSGIGLPSENLTRIFAHGFTTKRGGHGFGLHSGALAAKEMDGSLWAESAGLGCGATFTLELPLQVNSRMQERAAA